MWNSRSATPLLLHRTHRAPSATCCDCTWPRRRPTPSRCRPAMCIYSSALPPTTGAWCGRVMAPGRRRRRAWCRSRRSWGRMPSRTRRPRRPRRRRLAEGSQAQDATPNSFMLIFYIGRRVRLCLHAQWLPTSCVRAPPETLVGPRLGVYTARLTAPSRLQSAWLLAAGILPIHVGHLPVKGRPFACAPSHIDIDHGQHG